MLHINKIKYLYHGTNQDFDIFDFSKAQGFKDFGKGFYLTTNLSQAQKWVQHRLKGLETGHDIVYDRMADSQMNNISEMLQNYVIERISAQDVIKGIKWNEKSKADQYCFKTEKALSLLQKRVKFVQRMEPIDVWGEIEWSR